MDGGDGDGVEVPQPADRAVEAVEHGADLSGVWSCTATPAEKARLAGAAQDDHELEVRIGRELGDRLAEPVDRRDVEDVERRPVEGERRDAAARGGGGWRRRSSDSHQASNPAARTKSAHRARCWARAIRFSGCHWTPRTHQSGAVEHGGLDQAVRREGHRHEALRQPLDRLVMAAVDQRDVAGRASSPERRLGRRPPARCGPGGPGSSTSCGRSGWVLRRQVLPERAAEIDVEHLEPAADPPDGEPRARGRRRGGPTPCSSRSGTDSTPGIGAGSPRRSARAPRPAPPQRTSAVAPATRLAAAGAPIGRHDPDALRPARPTARRAST